MIKLNVVYLAVLLMNSCRLEPQTIEVGDKAKGGNGDIGGAADCGVTKNCDANGNTLPSLPSAPNANGQTPITGSNAASIEKFAKEAKLAGVLLQPPAEESVINGYGSLFHTKNLQADLSLTEVDGRRFYFEGLLPQAKSKSDFKAAVAEGEVSRYGWAQCAVTTSSVLEHAAMRVSLSGMASRFTKERRNAATDPLSCTDEVEVELRRLGWLYYLKSEFVAPTGAIALAKGRYNKCGTPDHSGHIYTILQDKGVTVPDLIADNGGYSHIYTALTGGFWLPLGIYPMRR